MLSDKCVSFLKTSSHVCSPTSSCHAETFDLYLQPKGTTIMQQITYFLQQNNTFRAIRTVLPE